LSQVEKVGLAPEIEPEVSTAISRRWVGVWRKEPAWRRNWSRMWMGAPSGKWATRIP